MMASLLLGSTPLILGLLTTHSLALPASSAPRDAEVLTQQIKILNCQEGFSNGQVFVAANAKWDIICGKDYMQAHAAS